MSKTERQRDLGKRRPELRAISISAAPLIGKALRRRGFFRAAVVRRWSSIAGSEIATWCRPERITFDRYNRGATLHLLAPGARALELQHLEPVLLERINTVFGYRAVNRIAIRHGPAPQPRQVAVASLRKLDAAEERWVQERIEKVANPDLRAALEALGRTMAARSGQRTTD